MAAPPDDDPPAPRWERPVEHLLTDTDWWDRWLPRLYEVLGRADSAILILDEDGNAARDERGYIDLLGRLFCRQGPSLGGRPSTLGSRRRGPLPGAHDGGRPPARIQAWEPVIGHVALALCALEDTGTPGSSPHLRLETLTRLTGTWVPVLNALVGGGSARLPDPVR
jgi:hypothetical protein